MKYYVLVGEMEGDYGDFYQRPAFPLAVSTSEKVLEAIWDSMEETKENDKIYKTWKHIDGGETSFLIDYYITEVDWVSVE